MPRKAPTTNQSDATDNAQAPTAHAPRVSVLNRRLQNPFGTPSRQIPLKGDKATGWIVRTFCVDPEHPDRHYDAVHRLGYIPLTKDDLAVDPESIGYRVTPDGRIARGPNSAEVLMGMPEAEYQAIQKAKSDANLRKLSPSYTRQEVAQATAKEHGSAAGDTIDRYFEQKDTVESITVGGQS